MLAAAVSVSVLQISLSLDGIRERNRIRCEELLSLGTAAAWSGIAGKADSAAELAPGIAGPGVRPLSGGGSGIAVLPVVGRGEREVFVERKRLSGFPFYEITALDPDHPADPLSAPESDRYLVMDYAKIGKGSSHVKGFDLYSIHGMDEVLTRASALGGGILPSLPLSVRPGFTFMRPLADGGYIAVMIDGEAFLASILDPVQGILSGTLTTTDGELLAVYRRDGGPPGSRLETLSGWYTSGEILFALPNPSPGIVIRAEWFCRPSSADLPAMMLPPAAILVLVILATLLGEKTFREYRASVETGATRPLFRRVPVPTVIAAHTSPPSISSEPPPESPVCSEPAAPKPSASKGVVVVAAYNETIRTAAAALLKARGYTVWAAASAAELADLFGETDPDAVAADPFLVKMSGVGSRFPETAVYTLTEDPDRLTALVEVIAGGPSAG